MTCLYLSPLPYVVRRSLGVSDGSGKGAAVSHKQALWHSGNALGALGSGALDTQGQTLPAPKGMPYEGRHSLRSVCSPFGGE